MEIRGTAGAPAVSALPDAEIVRRVRAGEGALFEILMRRHNQPLREAFGRRRNTRSSESLACIGADFDEDRGQFMDALISAQADPERQAYAQELHRVLEAAVDTLPEMYRTVFMMRDIEGLSTSETADGLGLGEEAVKTRLHRARAMIRRAVAARIGEVASGTFQFPASRCDRIVAAVLAAVSRE